MKKLMLALVALLGLATVAEANGGLFGFRRQRIVVNNFNAPAFVAPAQFYAPPAQIRVRLSSYSYGYAAPFVAPLVSDHCGGAAFVQPFRTRAFLGLGFGY